VSRTRTQASTASARAERAGDAASSAAPWRRLPPRRCARSGCRAPRATIFSQSSLLAPPPGAADAGLDAELAQKSSESRSPNATLEDRPHRARGRGGATTPRTRPRIRVGMRRPLALQVRQERKPLRPAGISSPRRPARRTPPTASRSQRSDPAAESITPIASQVSARRGRRHGPAPRVGSVPGRAAKPPGRSEHDRQRSRPTTPTPSAPACWSPAPPIAVDSVRRGSHSTGSPAPSRPPPTSVSTSKSSVPDASAASIARSPVSRSRT
jgi:hypothetical protein